MSCIVLHFHFLFVRNHAKGYGDLSANESIWFVIPLGCSLGFYMCSVDRFWFFAARRNLDKAPLVTWFNGGVSDNVSFYFAILRDLYQPGSSSMLGLFRELGPCRINNQSTGVYLNPTS